MGMVALAALSLGGWFLSAQIGRTGVVVTVRDALSGAPVRDSSLRFERWAVQGFSAPSVTLIHLLPGWHTLSAVAPGYLPASERIAVGLGGVTSAPPLALVGYAIPGLKGFAIAAEREARGILVRLAPVDDSGRFIREFPCLDLRIVLRVSIQVEGASVATSPTAGSPERGALLFDGVASWRWDSSPGAAYRYRALVRSDQLSALPAPYVVVDALVVVPDPRRIGARELDRVADELQGISDPAAVAAIERQYEGRVEIYRAVEWNTVNS